MKKHGLFLSFFQKRGSRNKNIQYYFCRRSGQYNPRGVHKRHLKIQGSCKIGSKCPASITATVTQRGLCTILLISLIVKLLGAVHKVCHTIFGHY